LKCHAGAGAYQKDVIIELNNDAHAGFTSATDDDIQCIGCHTAVTKVAQYHIHTVLQLQQMAYVLVPQPVKTINLKQSGEIKSPQLFFITSIN